MTLTCLSKGAFSKNFQQFEATGLQLTDCGTLLHMQQWGLPDNPVHYSKQTSSLLTASTNYLRLKAHTVN